MTGYTITCPHGTWSAGPTHHTAITYATLREANDAARVHFDAHGCMPTVHDDPRTRRDYVGGAA